MTQHTTVGYISWGLGQMGTGVARELEQRGWRMTGAISHQVGEDAGEVVTGHVSGVTVLDAPPETVDPATKLCVIATSSRVETCADQIRWAVTHGLNVVCSAEEMAYPWHSAPELATELDELAKAHGVSILGTGINPGFVMDILPVCLSTTLNVVDHIEVRRSNDLAPFGPSVLDSFGVGLTPDAFEAARAAGTIAGHVGFGESIALISEALGFGIDEIVEEMTPIVSTRERRTATRSLPAGVVVGCRQQAKAYAGGELRIVLDHPQQVNPEAEDMLTGDLVRLVGEPTVQFESSPEVPGGEGTIALMANSSAQLIDARPGMLTMLDLKVPRFARVPVVAAA